MKFHKLQNSRIIENSSEPHTRQSSKDLHYHHVVQVPDHQVQEVVLQQPALAAQHNAEWRHLQSFKSVQLRAKA